MRTAKRVGSNSAHLHSGAKSMAHDPKGERPHFTTRRGFIIGTGFGVVSLYALWAAYGAAPLRFKAHDEDAVPDHMGGHGGHGRARGHDVEEFRRRTAEFIEANKLADGSVRPRSGNVSPLAASDASHAGLHDPAQHAQASLPTATSGTRQRVAAVDVYLAAYQWGYLPAVLRLESGVPYRFHMMAVDVTHGASLRVGRGGHIIRLRAGTLVERELRFRRPGEHLVYCTIYCGMLHDRMQGKIIVT
jgi:cytochrome c oxidase subunit II